MIKRALTQYGIKEFPGEANNPEIKKYFDAIGETWAGDDETAWCSAYMNWAAKVSGYEYTGKLNARSWLNLGEPIERFQQVGDVAIFWRGSIDDWRGHVGMYISEDKDHVWVLGGNQSNMVRISAYSKSQILGYRRLRKI